MDGWTDGRTDGSFVSVIYDIKYYDINIYRLGCSVYVIITIKY